MVIDEILSRFEFGSRQDLYAFETFVLNLLKYHIESQNKSFSLFGITDRFGDAYVKDGFDNFVGETVIEIKFNLDRIPPRLLVNNIKYDLLKKETTTDPVNLIIIGFRRVSASRAQRIVDDLKSIYTNINVTIWGPEELNKIVHKHKRQANEIASNLFSLRLEAAVSKDSGDWQKTRDEKILLIKEVYERGQFSLFLGAEVSSSAGMPDWNTLVNSLFVSYLNKEFDKDNNISEPDIKEIIFRLNEIDEPSALIAARYLRKGFSKEISESQEFTKTVTENLYNLRDTSKDINSQLIISISNLCMPRRSGAKIRSVITYNFDDLLERQLRINSIQHHSIYTDNDFYDSEELPVYHVHGFLPENKKEYEKLEKSTLVFSEEGYHQIYTDAYHWSNLVQLNNLRENSCIMVGLSMADPNLRRLLDISARSLSKPKHFAFMRRLTLEKFIFSEINNGEQKKQVIKNKEGAERFLKKHHSLNEEIMKELGVSVIWFTDFSEIPDILNRINGK